MITEVPSIALYNYNYLPSILQIVSLTIQPTVEVTASPWTILALHGKLRISESAMTAAAIYSNLISAYVFDNGPVCSLIQSYSSAVKFLLIMSVYFALCMCLD